MKTEIIVAIIAFAGVILSALAAFIGSIIGQYINMKIAKEASRDKYALAALDKKLEIHQIAYDRTWEFPTIAHLPDDSEEKNKMFNDNHKWWRENCLFLEPKSRKAFFDALWNANFYKLYLEDFKESRDKSTKEYEEKKRELYGRWDSLFEARRIIENGVSKPLIKYVEETEEYTAEGKKEVKKTKK